ncbi:hypothetical protein ACH4UM_29965 [Streptomyces sp. NPDC020801]|uniref:hypothetical protein n=1 Tax=unclassified Streptomyces TaxID=2593676 RepID=UPI0037AA2950
MPQPPPPALLGERLPLGEALVVPEGLTEGRAEGRGVREGGLVRGLEGRGAGAGPVFAGGGALVVAGGLEAGDALRVGVGAGRRIPPLFRPRTSSRAGCVVSRFGGGLGESVTGSWDSSGSGWSGTDAARGAVDRGSTDAVATPPRTVKAAAARDLTAYFFSRGGRLCRAADRSRAGAGGQGVPGETAGPGSSSNRTFGIGAVESAAGAPGSAMSESYAPHSGHVTAPLSVRLHGMQ